MRERLVYVTKRVEFCAAHRLYREDFSAERNREVFGLCANPNGHGHNYVLEATFAGPIDPEGEMVIHFNSLKRLLEEVVVAPLDHKNLNLDVPFLSGVIPTSENVVVRLWERIEPVIAGQPWRLHRLRLSSSQNNWVEYLG